MLPKRRPSGLFVKIGRTVVPVCPYSAAIVATTETVDFALKGPLV